MPIESLFNKKISWRRKSSSTVDEFGEPIYTETLITSDANCAFQEITRDLIENTPIESNKRIFDLFLNVNEDLKAEDIMIFEGSDNYKVHNVADAAERDNHLEALVEQNREP